MSHGQEEKSEKGCATRQEWNPQSTVNHYKFTGYERDSESGNDNAEARYYASQYDRFLTPDPLGIISADLTDPQSLNEYVYVDDDPTDLTDPSGLDFNCIENPDGPGVVCWDGGLGGGGGEGGSTGVRPPLKPSQVKPPAPKPHRKRLKVVSDCLDGNGRWIDYKLVNDDGTPTEGQFSVTEHVTEQGGNFVHQSTDYPNVFNDFLGGLLFVGQSTNHLQSFTIAPGRGSAGGTPVPIQYLNGSLYGSQGIFIKNTGAQYPVILVNGAQASTVAPPGKKCPSDNK